MPIVRYTKFISKSEKKLEINKTIPNIIEDISEKNKNTKFFIDIIIKYTSIKQFRHSIIIAYRNNFYMVWYFRRV
jgi:hypothetical protein